MNEICIFALETLSRHLLSVLWLPTIILAEVTR